MIESFNYSSVGGTLQYTNPYGTFTFTEVPLKTLDYTPNMDNWTTVETSTYEGRLSSIKSRFTCGSLEGSAKMRDVWTDISSRADAAIEQFIDGTMNKDKFAEQFQSLANELFETSCRVGYPIPLVDTAKEQAVSEAFYDEVRRRILDIAVKRNNEQGKQYVTGEMNYQRSWKYYNSDYYYKSEAAIVAATKGMEEMGQVNNWNFTIPDYKGKGWNLYYNFNTAFSNNFFLSDQYLIDPDVEPPQGFEWFFQTGGDRDKYSHYGVLERKITTHADRSETVIQLINRDKFDPTDFLTGNTWIAYTDQNGKHHVLSKDIIFENKNSDLMNVGSLFELPVDEEWDKVEKFLRNLQLYPKGYFSRIADTISINCIV